MNKNQKNTIVTMTAFAAVLIILSIALIYDDNLIYASKKNETSKNVPFF